MYITASYSAVIDCVSKGIPVIQVRNSWSDIPQPPQVIWKREGFNKQPCDPLSWSPQPTASDAVTQLLLALRDNRTQPRDNCTQAWLDTFVWPHSCTYLHQLCEWLRLIIVNYPNGVGDDSKDTHL